MSHQQRSEPSGIVREFEVGRVSEAVVDAIAAAANDDPMSIAPIYGSVDPDALDSLFRTGGSDVSIGFSHEGFTVEVDGRGTIQVVRARDP